MLKKEQHSKSFSRPIIFISILGVALGVSVIILTISIATGFQNQIKNKLLSFGSHIQIESMFQNNNNETSPITLLNDSIASINSNYKLEKYAYKSAIIQNKTIPKSSINDVKGLLFKGIESFQQNKFLADYLISGTLPIIRNQINDTIILSKETCNKLQLKLFDKISGFFISNGKPRQRNMIVGGIYETGLDKLDGKFGFIDIRLIRKLNNWGFKTALKYTFNNDSTKVTITTLNQSKNGFILHNWGDHKIVNQNTYKFKTNSDTTIQLIVYEVNNLKDQNLINIPDTLLIHYSKKQKQLSYENIEGSDKFFCGGFELNLLDFEDREIIKSNFKKKLGPEFKVTTIDEQHEEIFSWLQLIYQNVYIVLILMIVVAIVNMSSALLVLIVEKTKMIGILKALGIQNISLRKIFIYHGGLLLSIGFIIGNLISIILIWIQNEYGILNLPQENYYLDKVPVAYPLDSVLIINLISFIFCLVAMVLPSIISSKISPIKAINSEI